MSAPASSPAGPWCLQPRWPASRTAWPPAQHRTHDCEDRAGMGCSCALGKRPGHLTHLAKNVREHARGRGRRHRAHRAAQLSIPHSSGQQPEPFLLSLSLSHTHTHTHTHEPRTCASITATPAAYACRLAAAALSTPLPSPAAPSGGGGGATPLANSFLGVHRSHGCVCV